MQKKGKKETQTKKETLFNSPINEELLALYIRVYRANQRQGTSNTKTRGDVSGGGKKPWRQKGTGRARQGSIRAPHFVHGGIAHGPKMKDWSLNFPAALRKKALESALSLKAKRNQIKTSDRFSLKAPKTKEFIKMLDENNIEKGSLIITPKYDSSLVRAGRNVKGINIRSALDVNVYDILKSKEVVLLNGSSEVLKGRYEA